MTFKKMLSKIFRFFLFLFSIIGFIFVAVLIAMQFNLLNVRGSVSERNAYFNLNKNFLSKKNTDESLGIICRINVLGKYAPLTSVNLYKTLEQGGSDPLIKKMIEAASVRFANYADFQKNMDNCENTNNQNINLPISAYVWADTDEWNLMKEVFTRDQEIINKAAKDAEVSPRIILSGIIGEQFRFFSSRRETFKNYFEPMKILASLSKTSYGIAGLKPKTAGLIEDHLKDQNSPYYLGGNMEHVLDYPENVNIDSERMNRITDAKDPYYSYLYVGLFMKQIGAQWQRAGYDISNRPEILSTLYNLGFYNSVPKSDPEAGGAVITIGGIDYTFGDLGYEFYYSGELANTFPILNK